MNTSDIISAGSRPLLPTTSPVYRQEPKDVLYTRLIASLKAVPANPTAGYDQSQFEFPGDRTRSRYRTDGGA